MAPYSASYQRVLIKTILDDAEKDLKLVSSSERTCITTLLARVQPTAYSMIISQVGESLRIGGWVKTGREAGAGAFAFIQINDGTAFESLQVCGMNTLYDYDCSACH